ncbi:hypothetical protein BKA70DRAFT_1417455 [Coprinopsis sp. MPI-PUGE-AT-0042]|nr:hypothetical protein BKA70DRAFT_1417455 [Coprinopsis sp. MPI-PUGE-AT-0042]
MTFLLQSSRVSLMHASLAQITPEVATLDSVRHGSQARLPAELLLLIRAYLIPIVAQELLSQSEAALTAHESTMMSLLCSECVFFLSEIYGTSVFLWPWDQFSGPCACRGANGEHAIRIDKFNKCIGSLRSFPPLKAPSEDRPSLQFPPCYLDAHYILESHLSRQARRMARLAYKDEISFSKRTASLLHPSRHNSSGFQENLSPESQKPCLKTRSFLRVRTIWDLAAVVAREQYGCHVFEACSTPSAAQGKESPYSDQSIIEINAFQRQPPFAAASHNFTAFHPITAVPNLPLHVGTPGRISPLQALYFPSGSNRANNVYLSPLHQDNAVILARGLRYAPRSQSIETQIQRAPSHEQVLSSEESQAIGPACPADEWASRTLLRRARRELGLDTDLIALQCSQGSPTHPESPASQNEGNLSANTGHPAQQVPSQVADDERREEKEDERESSPDGSEQTVTPPDATNTIVAASTSSLGIPTSSTYLSKPSGSCAFEFSALSTAILLALIGQRSYTGGCASGSGCITPKPASLNLHLQDSESDSQCRQEIASLDSGESSSSSRGAASTSRIQSRRPNAHANTAHVLTAFMTISPPSLFHYLVFVTGSMAQQFAAALSKLEVCISLVVVVPLAVAQVAMKVVCFYSKSSSSSFRLV